MNQAGLSGASLSSRTMATTTSGNSIHQSAKMMEAQAFFQRVVKQELQVLLSSGMEREVAVKVLLHRIVESTEEPEENDVRRVMKQFQMNHDDAVRALIVKQEIGRLKRQGLDAFAAIEELTRKMQRVSTASSQAEAKQDESTTTSNNDQHAADSDVGDGSNQEPSSDVSTDVSCEDQATIEERTSQHQNTSDDDHEAVADDEEKNAPSSMLCERINQVSISTESANAPYPLVPSESPSTRSAFELFSATSRKRRVIGIEPSPPSSPTRHVPTPSSAGASRTDASPAIAYSTERPASPTFRFPKTKKLKTMSDTTGSFISRKTVVDEVPGSPTAISARADVRISSPEVPPSLSLIGKRQRMTGSSSPLFDSPDEEEPVVHVTKRHRK
ncbi:hypothetical protein PINS_up011648 [Pythium insidiosum]|nr:hypothetical protein PINS_up011648 [Pythium insidiosum]